MSTYAGRQLSCGWRDRRRVVDAFFGLVDVQNHRVRAVSTLASTPQTSAATTTSAVGRRLAANYRLDGDPSTGSTGPPRPPPLAHVRPNLNAVMLYLHPEMPGSYQSSVYIRPTAYATQLYIITHKRFHHIHPCVDLTWARRGVDTDTQHCSEPAVCPRRGTGTKSTPGTVLLALLADSGPPRLL